MGRFSESEKAELWDRFEAGGSLRSIGGVIGLWNVESRHSPFEASFSRLRTTGGAVTGAVLMLVLAPPLVVQIAGGAASWIPPTLANVVSGVSSEVTVLVAIAALVLWASVPASIGLVSTVKRDVV